MVGYVNRGDFDWEKMQPLPSSSNEKTAGDGPPEPKFGDWLNAVKRGAVPCHYCGAAASTIDYKRPRSLGGKTFPWNVVSACAPCITLRGNSPYEQFKASGWKNRPFATGMMLKLCLTHHALERYGLTHMHMLHQVPKDVITPLAPNLAWRALQITGKIALDLKESTSIRLSDFVEHHKARKYSSPAIYYYHVKSAVLYTCVLRTSYVTVVTITKLLKRYRSNMAEDLDPQVRMLDIEKIWMPYSLVPGPVDERLLRAKGPADRVIPVEWAITRSPQTVSEKPCVQDLTAPK